MEPDLKVETFFEKDEAAKNGSELRKKYTLRLLLTCLEVLEERFFCFPGIDWEGVSRNLFSLVKLYQRI